MRKAVRDCLQLRSPIDPQLLISWSKTLCEAEPESLLCITTEEFKNVIIPAFIKLRPSNSYYTDARPEVNNINPGRARLTLARLLEATERRPLSFCGPIHAEQGVPHGDSSSPELARFIAYSKALLERKTIQYMMVIIEFDDNLCCAILVDLSMGKLEVLSNLHIRLTYNQAKEWEDALIWFSLFQFHKRVVPLRSLKVSPEPHIFTLAIAMYLMLRLRYKLTRESAALTCTLANLHRFIGHIEGTCTEDIQVVSNLFFR